MVVLADKRGVALLRTAPPRRRGEPPPVTRWERKLRPGEDAQRAAKDLLWRKYEAGKKGSDFNRPLVYPPSNIV